MWNLVANRCGSRKRQGAVRLEYDEKQQFHDTSPKQDLDELVRELVATIRDADASHADLASTLQEIVRKAGWWNEHVAQAVINAIEYLVQSDANMGEAFADAYNKAVKEAKRMEEFADDFAAKHPFIAGLLCTVLAIGILWLVWPEILEAIGFSMRGPTKRTVATWWQRRYGERVPAKSLFAYLQRLGMVMRK